MWVNIPRHVATQPLPGVLRYPSRLQNSLATGFRPMKAALVELISKISSGCMSDDEIIKVADEAAQAYADPQAFLTANPDINFDETFPIPLGEWVVVGSLPETVLFQADTYMDLFAQIVASFGPGVDFNIKPKQLAKTEALTALNRIQVQLGSMNKENGGYVLMNFSQLLDDELQGVLVYGNDVPRVLELCAQIGISAAPSLEALKVAIHV
jgi:hypothetical protein